MVDVCAREGIGKLKTFTFLHVVSVRASLMGLMEAAAVGVAGCGLESHVKLSLVSFQHRPSTPWMKVFTLDASARSPCTWSSVVERVTGLLSVDRLLAIGERRLGDEEVGRGAGLADVCTRCKIISQAVLCQPGEAARSDTDLQVSGRCLRIKIHVLWEATVNRLAHEQHFPG